MFVIRVVLACYPPSFRDRYGQELAALVEDTGWGPRVCWDLVRAAAAAWLRPVFPGRLADRTRRRLQAGLSTVWVAWCVEIFTVPVVDRALLDPPGPGATEMVRMLESDASGIALAGAVLAAGCALLLALRVLVPALRSRRWRVCSPLLPVAVLLATEMVGAMGVWMLRRRYPVEWLHPSAGFLAVLLCWLAGMVALAVFGAAGPPVMLRRANPPTRSLRLPVVLAVGVVAALTALAIVQAAAVLLAGPGPVGIGGTAVAVLATGAALVSICRTIPFLQTAPA